MFYLVMILSYFRRVIKEDLELQEVSFENDLLEKNTLKIKVILEILIKVSI